MISKLLGGVELEDDIPNEQTQKRGRKDKINLYNKFDINTEKSLIPGALLQPKSLTPSEITEKWFPQMDGRIGKLSPKDLQEAFLTFQGKHFSDASCKFVVRLFDLDKNGGLDVPEFEQLYTYVKQWVTAFNSVDRGRTGVLDETQFDYALKEMNINFSPDFIKFLLTKSDPGNRRITLDQFIVTCVQIQKYTDEFKERDPNMSGNVTLKYEDFLEILMKCT